MKKIASSVKTAPTYELIQLGKAWLLRKANGVKEIHLVRNKFILIADNKRDAMKHAKSITSLNKGKLIVLDREGKVLHKFSFPATGPLLPRSKALHYKQFLSYFR